ncbi:MAG: hypothetical protein IJQ31_14230 [Thermoguttaceae bacterium]|nr:hypothetical protein [Thermoguttaceae bacterium]
MQGLEHYEAEAFSGFESFLKVYKHCSALSFRFETLSFQRWFVMREFVKRFGIKRFLHIDSDVLLFCDVTELASRFEGYDVTLMHWDETRNMGHFFLLNRMEFLDEFCEYVLKIYQDDAEFERLKSKNFSKNKKRKKSFWISDMSFLGDFYECVGDKAFFLEECRKDGLFFDDRITYPNSFQAEFGVRRKQRIKKVRFLEGRPFVFTEDGKPMVVQMLHFHSFTKFLMPYYVCGRIPHWRYFWRTLILEHKIVKKFLKIGMN